MLHFDSKNHPSNRTEYAPDEAIILHNRAIFYRFWRNQYSALVARARTMCGGSQDKAEDLVSQATLRMVQFVEAHDRPLLETGALFWRILRNAAIDQHRSARRAATIYDHSVDIGCDAGQQRLPPAADDTLAQLVATEALAEVHRRLSALPEDSRTLFVHRFVEDRSYREIAAHFRISEALARKRIQKLRALLAEEDDVALSQKRPSHVYPYETV